jgi:hypothetical protein
MAKDRLAAVASALRAKAGPRTSTVDDGRDPTRDPEAVRRCPHVGSGCPKRVGVPCAMAAGCPIGLGGSGPGGGVGGGAKRVSAFDKRRLPDALHQLGHHAGSEAEREQWAYAHGMREVAARQRDEATHKSWNAIRDQVLAIDVKERPVLRMGIDVSREQWEAIPRDVQALVGAHLISDSCLDGA